MSKIILQTHELTKRFGDVLAVDRVNLSVRAGEVFGFLGPNGAGKTTTIGLALGLIWPSGGRVELFGRLVTPTDNGALAQVGSLAGAPALLPYLSGRANLRLLARLAPAVDEARVEEVLNLVELTEAAGRKFAAYSTGMKQRLGLAAALLHRPQLVILDEPTNGLDPAGMREIRTLLRSLAADGTTVFLSSHLLHEVEQVCDRIAVLNRGRVVAQGPVSELLGKSAQLVKVKVPSPAAAREALRSLTGVRTLEANGAYVQVGGASGEAIVAHLVAQGIVPGEVIIDKSDLEDLFLELTRAA